jgi:glc operon protein GlcG
MTTAPVLELADAQRALETIQRELVRRRVAAVIAVADEHGELIALTRMDGAPLASVRIAENKAFSAARERKSTAEIGRAARDPVSGFDIGYYGDPRYLGWGGGVPVVIAGVVVGAVAVSGAPEELDVEMAALGAQAIADVATATSR